MGKISKIEIGAPIEESLIHFASLGQGNANDPIPSTALPSSAGGSSHPSTINSEPKKTLTPAGENLGSVAGNGKGMDNSNVGPRGGSRHLRNIEVIDDGDYSLSRPSRPNFQVFVKNDGVAVTTRDDLTPLSPHKNLRQYPKARAEYDYKLIQSRRKTGKPYSLPVVGQSQPQIISRPHIKTTIQADLSMLDDPSPDGAFKNLTQSAENRKEFERNIKDTKMIKRQFEKDNLPKERKRLPTKSKNLPKEIKPLSTRTKVALGICLVFLILGMTLVIMTLTDYFGYLNKIFNKEPVTTLASVQPNTWSKFSSWPKVSSKVTYARILSSPAKITCKTLACYENQYCEEINGVAECFCVDGYTGEMCQNDIDECNNGDNTCNDNELCDNTPGSYVCIKNMPTPRAKSSGQSPTNEISTVLLLLLIFGVMAITGVI